MKNTPAQFDISKADSKLIRAIVDRTMTLRKKAGFPATVADRQNVSMDIVACHRNGNALDLTRLLSADDANFGHDVFGISRYIDRHSGQLTDHFLPRFSAPKAKLKGRTSKRDKWHIDFVERGSPR